ncbi:MAG: Hpt domain-containing protein, partial [Methanoregula sp.]|nr:Hpt domain-containing protein [Methanoregula sp.]
MSEFEAYRGLFVAESRENHENLVRNLLLLEEGTYENTIDEIFRSLHTLKGASASMGFSTMEHLCHTMEDVFSLIRNGSAEISSDLINLLLACSDLIEQMLDDIESGGDSSQIQTGEQVTALKQWFTDQSNPSQDGTNGMEDSPVVQSNDDTPEKTGAQNGEESRPQYDMRITVAADCQMKDVRAMLVLENLD